MRGVAIHLLSRQKKMGLDNPDSQPVEPPAQRQAIGGSASLMERWYVVETKPSSEQLGALHLRNQGYFVLLPTFLEQRASKRGRVDIKVPVFRRYLFLFFDIAETRWRSINGTLGVRRILGNDPEKPQALPQRVGDKLVAEYGAGPKPLDPLLEIMVGSSARVLEGPLQGIAGKVMTCDRARVSLLLYVMGRLTEVAFDTSAVEAIAA